MSASLKHVHVNFHVACNATPCQCDEAIQKAFAIAAGHAAKRFPTLVEVRRDVTPIPMSLDGGFTATIVLGVPRS